MEIYTIKNSPIEENSFIIADPDSNLCMVIDPFDEASITSCLESRSLKLQYILLTHEHIDHIRAVNGLRDRYKCKLVCSQKCSNNICDSRKNLSDFFKLLLEINGTIEIPENFEAQFAGYRCEPADITFEDDYSFFWQGHHINCIWTPGHTDASICILIDKKFLFSGDSLLLKTETTTKLPTGSWTNYTQITIPRLCSLGKDVIVYPGHGESFLLKNRTIGEVK